MIPAVADAVSPTCMVWASDYPHYDAEWPGAVDEMTRRDDLTPVLKRAVMADNADRWFRLV
jgi:hypothetical protein